ncbi:MAG: class I SAM-dependent methyltransferase [Gammaproteobacteria bacterium]|nr:class I SAM-dependent methyltransferase [Gammaproteobacteria bacterium]
MSIPADYYAWYQSTRGRWIGQKEFSILLKLFTPKAGQSLLDVGCGTGYFSQHFQQLGLQVTGLDPDSAMIDFAKSKESQIKYVKGDAIDLPFADNSFDYCSAITSLCFVADPEKAISEMLRVSRHGVILGLLNRHSLLYYKKNQSAGYLGARWDTISDVQQWCNNIKPDLKMMTKSAVWIASAGIISKTLEFLLPATLPYGGFLAVAIESNNG